jgi:dephospho-CoA kinase
MKFVVIGISGKQGAGKTTLANALNETLKGRYSTAHIIKFAQPLYDMASSFYDILGVEMKHKDGVLMQIVGNHARTKLGEDVFVNAWMKNAREKLKLHLNGNDVQYVICDDMRFENEADGIKQFAESINGSCLLVRIEEPEEKRKARIPDTWRDNVNHPSEIGLDQYYKFDMKFEGADIGTMVSDITGKLLK